MPDMYVRRRNDILWLLLNKNPHNILSVGILEQCVSALQKALSHSPQLIVMTSTGDDAFSIGCEPSPPTSEAKQVALTLTEMFQRLRGQHIPTVALVKGDAFDAGCELAALCDTIIARDDAHFRFSPSSTTLFPTTHASFIGEAASEQSLPPKETLDAWQAMRLGFVQQVIPARRFAQDTEELLVMLASTTQHS